MIEENARVVRVDGEYAWVETGRRGACGSCSAEKGCGTASLGRLFNPGPVQVRAQNRAGAREGDAVVVGLQDEILVRSSLVVYLLPLVFMLAGAMMAQALAKSEGWVALAGLAGLGAGFAVVALFGRRAARNPRYQAVVLRQQDPFCTPVPLVKK